MKRHKKIYEVQKDGTKIDFNYKPLIAHKGCRAGCIMYDGIEIPETAHLFKNKLGEECYLSGVEKLEDEYIATVKYFRRETNQFEKYLYSKVEPYL